MQFLQRGTTVCSKPCQLLDYAEADRHSTCMANTTRQRARCKVDNRSDQNVVASTVMPEALKQDAQNAAFLTARHVMPACCFEQESMLV